MFTRPLSVGSHVDHRLVRACVDALRKSTYQIYYYEDFPYCDPEFPWTTGETPILHKRATSWIREGLLPTVTSLSQGELNMKIQAVQCYKSQSNYIFGANAEEIFRSYSDRVSTNANPAERYWAKS